MLFFAPFASFADNHHRHRRREYCHYRKSGVAPTWRLSPRSKWIPDHRCAVSRMTKPGGSPSPAQAQPTIPSSWGRRRRNPDAGGRMPEANISEADGPEGERREGANISIVATPSVREARQRREEQQPLLPSFAHFASFADNHHRHRRREYCHYRKSGVAPTWRLSPRSKWIPDHRCAVSRMTKLDGFPALPRRHPPSRHPGAAAGGTRTLEAGCRKRTSAKPMARRVSAGKARIFPLSEGRDHPRMRVTRQDQNGSRITAARCPG